MSKRTDFFSHNDNKDNALIKSLTLLKTHLEQINTTDEKSNFKAYKAIEKEADVLLAQLNQPKYVKILEKNQSFIELKNFLLEVNKIKSARKCKELDEKVPKDLIGVSGLGTMIYSGVKLMADAKKSGLVEINYGAGGSSNERQNQRISPWAILLVLGGILVYEVIRQKVPHLPIIRSTFEPTGDLIKYENHTITINLIKVSRLLMHVMSTENSVNQTRQTSAPPVDSSTETTVTTPPVNLTTQTTTTPPDPGCGQFA